MSEEHLCMWDKQKIGEKITKLTKIVKKPKYLCKKCGRVAEKKMAV